MRFDRVHQAELDQERWKETEGIQTRNPLRAVQRFAEVTPFMFSLLHPSWIERNRSQTMISYLQRLAANELRPPADLGWDTFRARELLAHALSKEHGSLQTKG